MDLFLLLGQSNMAGRGTIVHSPKKKRISTVPSPLIIDGHEIYSFNCNNEWIPAQHPLHYDKPHVCGVGPGLAFAKVIAILDCVGEKRKIGLIPCAMGGSSLNEWFPTFNKNSNGMNEQTLPEMNIEMKNEIEIVSNEIIVDKNNLYNMAVKKSMIAIQSGDDFVLRAILWHQGESDSRTLENAKKYTKNAIKIFQCFRESFNNNSLPILIAGLGDFLMQNASKNFTFYAVVNRELESIPLRLDNVLFVPANKLSHKGDWLHFDAESANILGNRFALEYAKISVIGEQNLNQYQKLKRMMERQTRKYNRERISITEKIAFAAILVSAMTVIGYCVYRKYRRYSVYSSDAN